MYNVCIFLLDLPCLLQHNLDPEATELPVGIRCSAERLQDDGVYLLGLFVVVFFIIFI